MLGLRPSTTVIEAAGYLVYAVPMLLLPLWPQRWRPGLRRRDAVAA
jgi:hypothetical protein